MSEKLWKDAARIIVDAFDVDIQLFYTHLLEKFRNTPLGNNFAAFAEKNPAAFEAFLRVLSVVVQKLPKDKNILTETIADHLQRLPVELRRAMFGNGVAPAEKELSISTMNNAILGDAFNLKYEESLVGLSNDHLKQVASLEKKQLYEWVNSPKKIRPLLLERWKEEIDKRMFSSKNNFIKDISNWIVESKKNNSDDLKQGLERAKFRYEESVKRRAERYRK